MFQGEGGGVYILKPPAAGILYAPPRLEGYFQGWGGGWGCIKFACPHKTDLVVEGLTITTDTDV